MSRALGVDKLNLGVVCRASVDSLPSKSKLVAQQSDLTCNPHQPD